MGFSIEWSRPHKHKSGEYGRDTVIRNPLGKVEVKEVRGEPFKTIIEDISLPEGTIKIEKDLTGRVIRAYLDRRASK